MLVITLSGILSVVVGVFIAKPIYAYRKVILRAQLVDAADQSLHRISRDIQRAVPNSLRVKVDPSNSQRIAVEMLNIVEGMRYRTTGPGSFLNFIQPVTQFNVIGQFQYAMNNPTCMGGNCRIVVYNTGANMGGAIPSDNPAPGANVYSTLAAPSCSGCLPPPGSVNITPASTTVTLSNAGSEGSITLGAATLFGLPSARQRVAVVDTPVTYLCDVSAGVKSITRYWGYSINAIQPTNPSLPPLNTAQSALLTNGITGCSFNYAPGSPQSNGLITMKLTFSNEDGESITLLQQVSVDNSP